MTLALAGLLAAAASPAAAQGCLEKLPVVIESGSIRSAAPSGVRFEETAMEQLRSEGGAVVKAAAAKLCRDRTLSPARLKPYRTVVLHQGSACANVCVREDHEQFGGPALVIDYIYAEESLKPPPQAAVETALRCWADPACPKEAD